jgi:uncharacterized membrane protein YfcA
LIGSSISSLLIHPNALINSIYLAFLHSIFLSGIPWNIAAFTILGAVFGARLAPLICQRIGSGSIKVILATIAIADGLLFLIQAMAHPN